RVEQAVAEERDEVLTLARRQHHGRREGGVEAFQHRRTRSETESQSLVRAGAFRVVFGGTRQRIEVELDRITETRERAVVEERRLQREIPERRRAERVAVRGIARHLLQPEVLVL